MRHLTFLLIAAMLGLAPLAASAADEPKNFTDAEKAAIEDVVREFITKKEPDVVMKAVQEMQNRQQADAADKSKNALTTSHEKIFNDPNSPVGGNPKGDVTVVEFFDYQCGYCKASHEPLSKLVAGDKNVKIVFKEYPILGPNSLTASKAAFAAIRQGKYEKFHNALMTEKEHLSDDVINKAAKAAGLDVEKLHKDMADPEIEKLVQSSLSLGSDIGVRGTPMFIIGDQLYPGALQFEQMKQAVETARKTATK